MRLAVMWMVMSLSVGVSRSAAQCGTQSPTQSLPDMPDANPGRPTVSTPATLTPVGYLQFESGVLFAEDSTEFSKRVGVSEVIKLSVASRLELFLQTEPLAISKTADPTSVHEGEVFAGVQGVLLGGGEGEPTLSVSYARRLHASVAPELDIGTSLQSGTILLSGELHGFHVDTNGIVTEQIQNGVHRAQYGETLSISHPVGKFTVSGEIWHFSQPFERGNTVGNLWAVSYAARKNLVFDGGFNHGFTHTSTRWEAFVGFTYLLPHRLWPDHHDHR